ncbi:MAG: xanthine dehydrogenase family protein molybdopterin-binding subunit [Saprospiraceae bacterium]|nr:xanthine dehydrogenase family protein molybdopterin-binding subunit [Saprospiraceae bacterium]
MSRRIPTTLNTRRQFLQNTGRLLVALPFLPACKNELTPASEAIAWEAVVLEKLPGSLRRTPQINAWLEVLEDGRVRVFSGKVELGQGIRNAIRQVAAEELCMDLDRIEVLLAETGVTPNEGYTAGSGSIQNSAMAVRYAAAAAREELLALAAAQMEVPVADLRIQNGYISSKGLGGKDISFHELLAGQQIEAEVPLDIRLKPKSAYQFVGKSIPRADLPNMVQGKPMFIHDLRFPGMLHARVLRPKNYQSTLLKFDEGGFRSKAKGILQVVRDSNFLAILTTTEYEAETGVKLLDKYTSCSKPAIFPTQEELPAHLKEIADSPKVEHGTADIPKKGANKTNQASFFKPYTMHAALGPACAIAQYDGEILHIWSHSQGIYPMRAGLANMLQLPEEKIHVISSPGAGCYGHTVADDAAADAAILAMAVPGKHIRVRWSRADEHRWEPYGSAMLMELEASLDADGKINYWKSDIWTDSHSTRPNKNAATLLPARHLAKPFEMTSRGYLKGGVRNADPYYSIPSMQVVAHYFDGPLRVSSLRSLGAFANIFAIESFMDELAMKAGSDPITFRLSHLEDERAKDVVNGVKDMTKDVQIKDGEGLGYAFCRYKNYAAYCAMAVLVSVDKPNNRINIQKCWAAVDVGEIINPDGVKNQVEGAIVQAIGWTLSEAVTFDKYEITSTDWISYSSTNFSMSPKTIEVQLIDRADQPAMGGGEAGTPPVAAAICNAVFRACGKRILKLPVQLNRN